MNPENVNILEIQYGLMGIGGNCSVVWSNNSRQVMIILHPLSKRCKTIFFKHNYFNAILGVVMAMSNSKPVLPGTTSTALLGGIFHCPV